jgi:hypothetical protein
MVEACSFAHLSKQLLLNQVMRKCCVAVSLTSFNGYLVVRRVTQHGPQMKTVTNVLNWLAAHKDSLTLLGGAIGAVCVAGWTLFKWSNDRKARTNSAPGRSSPLLEGNGQPVVNGGALELPGSEEPKVYLQEKSPNEVVARINSLNPLERDLVAKQTYIGRWVRWSGTILSVEPFRLLESGGYTVTIGEGSFVFARLGFLPTERHLVEPLQEGDLINYEAKITHVLGSNIYLTTVTVTQPEERTFADTRPEDLTRVFEEHTEIQARARVADAIGKWMKVSGPLGNVGDFTSFAQVTFAHRPSPHPIVYMYFRKKKSFDRVSVLNRGNHITVVGRITEVKYGEVHLDNCEVMDS